MMICPQCGTEIPTAAAACPKCKPRTIGPIAPPSLTAGPAMPGARKPDPLERFVMPTATSGWAIAAGYAGLFALTIVFAPVALILGIVAYRNLKRHPELHGWGRTYLGLVLGGLGTALLLFFFVMLVVEQMTKP